MEFTFKGIKTLTLSPYHSLYDSNLCIKQQNTGHVFSEYKTNAFSEHNSCWRRSTAKEVGAEWSNQGGTSNILSVCYCTFASFSHRNNSYWTLQKKPRIPQQQFPNTACLVPNRINIKLCENDGNGNSGSSSSHCWLCSTLHMWGGVCQAPSRVTGKHSHSSTSIAHAQVVPSSWSTSNCLDVFLT